MLPDASIQTLKTLHLHGMAQALDELARQGSPRYHEALPFLTTLLKAEVAERAVRSTAYQMKAARFPAYRDLSSFDFTQSPVDEALMRQLHNGEFMPEAHNVVLVGGPGTGKTHLATALGVQAVAHLHRRVRFFSTLELVNALEQEKAAGKQGALATRLATLDLVILDELGYLPLTGRRRLAVPPDRQAVRTRQPCDHHQPQLRRVGFRVRRPEDDHRIARPAHPSLPHPGNRQRQLPLQDPLHRYEEGDPQGKVTRSMR